MDHENLFIKSTMQIIHWSSTKLTIYEFDNEEIISSDKKEFMRTHTLERWIYFLQKSVLCTNHEQRCQTPDSFF